MRAFVFVSAASLAVLGPAAIAEAAPRRVASLNLCTDELLLLLAQPQQIVSLTYLAHNPLEAPFWKAARPYRVNDGSLLSVAAMKPDLVLTMGGGARDRAHIAARLNIATLNLPYPQRLADLEASITRVAVALGRSEVGKRLLARIAALKMTIPSRMADTIWMGGGGRSVADTGLAADWMKLAGMHQRRLRGDRVSLEQLLLTPPSILLRSNYRANQYSGEQRWLSHPLTYRALRRVQRLTTDGRRWTCMGPSMIEEIGRLRREVRR